MLGTADQQISLTSFRPESRSSGGSGLCGPERQGHNAKVTDAVVAAIRAENT